MICLEKKIFIPKIDVMDLVRVQEKLVLGLDFILNENRSLTITKDYLLISDNTQLSPIIEEYISELREKRGETTLTKESFDDCNNCNSKKECQCKTKGLINQNILETIDEENNLTDYEISLQKETDYNIVRINKTITFDNIQQIIDRLNKSSIIGEDPTKYWEKDPIICNLDIINPDLIIKTKDIPYSNFEQEECKNHIKALLQLKVIEPSTSPHRSPAFIVNKHSEQKRGKTRMVYNYKRLNDNTQLDGYTIPSKDVLINRIQKAK